MVAVSDLRVVSTELLAARKIVDRLMLSIPADDADKTRRLTECAEWLNHADEALAAEKRFLSYFKRFLGPLYALDVAYQRLHYVRNSLCLLLPVKDLHTIVQKLRFDNSYVVENAERLSYSKKLDRIMTLLEASPALSTAGGNTVSEDLVRQDLAGLSQAIAYRREHVWHKVNLLRTRLMVTLWVLVGLLLACYVLVPRLIDEEIYWYQVCGLQVFGALGGALSAMLTRQEMDAQIAQYYVKLTSLYLRPAIGAAMGFTLGLLQFSEVVAIFPNNGDEKLFIAALVAFLGGFSERLFLSRIDVLESEKKSARRNRS